MDTKDVVTLTIAAYGALLSTYNAIKQRQEKGAKISVTPGIGLLFGGIGVGLQEGTYVLLTVANPGHKTVTIQSPEFLLPDGRVLTFLKPLSNVNFPHKLEPEESCVVYTDVHHLALQLAENGYMNKITLIPCCRDQVGRRYKGKKWKFDVRLWTKV